MADLSFSFDPAAIATNSDAASSALALAAAASNTASAASVAAADGSNALSKITARSVTWDKASAASSVAAAASNAVSSMGDTVIRSVPGVNSRAVHEILYTSAGLIKYVYSSLAA